MYRGEKMPNVSKNIRRKKILDKLNIYDKIYVTALAEELQVTTETIRRDLDYLDSNRLLKKVFGGAVKLKDTNLELSYEKRSKYKSEEKRLIASNAAEMIDDNDSVAILGGSTTEQMVPFLLKKNNLTVITNSITIANKLTIYQGTSQFNGQILLLGGKTNPSTMAASGYFTEQFLSSLSFNKAFLSCGGFSFDSISTYMAEHIRLSQILLEKADVSILLADSSKLNVKNLYKFANLKDIDVLVTNVEMPKEWNRYSNDLHLDWINK